MKSQNRYVRFLVRSALAILVGLGLALLLNIQAVASEARFDVLTTKTDKYEKVTVTGRNKTDIFITHSRGMGNVKIKDLDAETLWKLGLGPEPAKPVAVAGSTAGPAAGVPVEGQGTVAVLGTEAAAGAELPETLAGLSPQLQAQMQAAMAWQQGMPEIALSSINPVFIGVVIAIVLFFHLFFSYCLKLIVEKAGAEAGFLVWIPVLQMFPMLRGAGMSGWWFLAFWIPILNLVASILWCVKIVQARGKSVWVTIFLILPFTNLFAFLYLAFSNGEARTETRDESVSLGNPPVLLDA